VNASNGDERLRIKNMAVDEAYAGGREVNGLFVHTNHSFTAVAILNFSRGRIMRYQSVNFAYSYCH